MFCFSQDCFHVLLLCFCRLYVVSNGENNIFWKFHTFCMIGRVSWRVYRTYREKCKASKTQSFQFWFVGQKIVAIFLANLSKYTRRAYFRNKERNKNNGAVENELLGSLVPFVGPPALSAKNPTNTDYSAGMSDLVFHTFLSLDRFWFCCLVLQNIFWCFWSRFLTLNDLFILLCTSGMVR